MHVLKRTVRCQEPNENSVWVRNELPMMSRRSVLGVLACLAGCGAGLQARGQQGPVVAHVLEATGEWRLHGTAGKLAAGQGLAAGASIDAVSNRPGDAITIVRDEDMSRQRMA